MFSFFWPAHPDLRKDWVFIWHETTVEPRAITRGQGTGKILFAITRFRRYIEVLFRHTVYYYYRGKGNRSLYRGRRYVEVPYYRGSTAWQTSYEKLTGPYEVVFVIRIKELIVKSPVSWDRAGEAEIEMGLVYKGGGGSFTETLHYFLLLSVS